MSPELEKKEEAQAKKLQIEEEKDPGYQSLAEALRISFIILKIGISIVIIYFFLSGLFVVQSDEQAIKLRFGRIVGTKADQIIPAGIHWAWPAPIDEIIKFPVEKTQLIRLSTFWHEPSVADTKEGRVERKGVGMEKGYALTGDLNILHSQWEIRYRISDPVKYLTKMYFETEQELARKNREIQKRRESLFERLRERRKKESGDEHKKKEEDTEFVDRMVERAQKNVDNFVRACICNAILKEIAQVKIKDALSTAKESITVRVESRVKNYFDEIDCGIELKQITLSDITYPPEVKEAFNDVFLAEQQKDTMRKAAQAYETKILSGAEGEKAAIISAAETYKVKVVKSAEADADYIKNLLAKYPNNPEKLKHFLDIHHQEVVQEVLDNAQEKFILPATGKGEKMQLRVQIPRDEQLEREKLKEKF